MQEWKGEWKREGKGKIIKLCTVQGKEPLGKLCKREGKTNERYRDLCFFRGNLAPCQMSFMYLKLDSTSRFSYILASKLHILQRALCTCRVQFTHYLTFAVLKVKHLRRASHAFSTVNLFFVFNSPLTAGINPLSVPRFTTMLIGTEAYISCCLLIWGGGGLK